MKYNFFIQYVRIIFISLLLLSGCGENVGSSTSTQQPKDTTNLIRAVADEIDWTWFVGTDALKNASELTLDVYFTHNIPVKVQHFQYFLDTDNNANTGLSFGRDSWKISGADFLIEDGKLYKSMSRTTWSWKYVRHLSHYDKQIDGDTAQIHMIVDSNIISANTINITIEPFDANWGSTYSTISTQAIQVIANTVAVNSSDAKIFIIGDSTVHNASPGEMGWGSKLGSYMKNPTNVFNRARAGASTRSYKSRQDSPRNWSYTKNLIKNTDISQGAYLLIQFGANDEDPNSPYFAASGRNNRYYNELKVFVDEARELGVTPVLVTSINRFHRGVHVHKDYPITMRYLAEDENVLLVDLENKSFNEYLKYPTSEAIRNTFSYDDVAHFNPQGATIVAGWVKELICASGDANLCRQFR